jgi:phosphate transport system substrate-binding protein
MNVSLDRPKRLGGLALAATLLVAACSSTGATSAPSAAPTAAAPSAAAPSAAEPSTGASPAGSMAAGTPPTVPTADVQLQGAGATFPAPLYTSWFETYSGANPNIKIDYQAIGSGGGIKGITDQTVDFGASDAAMKDEEIAALKPGVSILHVPTALGAVVVIYNVPDATAINLDADTIAGLFAGTIKNWNDPKIAALNSGATLPDLPVTVVHRSDGSGTTNAFTTYLDTVNADWHASVGAGKEVQWPSGIGAQGNDGVAGGVKQTPGAVGYVELNYATQANIPSALVKNAAGKFVAGSTDGVTAAAESAVANFPADFRQAPIINGAGDTTYPIASYTYLLIPVDWSDLNKAQAMVSFTYWALTDGQSAEATLGYAPLPAEIQQKSIEELHKVTSGGTPVWP